MTVPRTFTARQLAFIGTSDEPQLSIVVDANKIMHVKLCVNMVDLLADEIIRFRKANAKAEEAI